MGSLAGCDVSSSILSVVVCDFSDMSSSACASIWSPVLSVSSVSVPVSIAAFSAFILVVAFVWGMLSSIAADVVFVSPPASVSPIVSFSAVSVAVFSEFDA